MFATADLCDRHEGKISIAAPLFRAYGANLAYRGRIRTVKVYEDNVLVKQELSVAGNGAVLVIDGGGSLRCALVGDQLAARAVANGWSGIVVNGCIRDSRAISEIAIGIRALAVHPSRSPKKGAGEVGMRYGSPTSRSHPAITSMLTKTASSSARRISAFSFFCYAQNISYAFPEP